MTQEGAEEQTRGYDLEIVKQFLDTYKLKRYDEITREQINEFEPHGRCSLAGWKHFLNSENWDYRLEVFRDAGSDGNIEGLPEVKLKDLYVQHQNEYIELEKCKVASISDTEPYPALTRFVCLSCKEKYEIKNNVYGIRPRCDCDKPNVIKNTLDGGDILINSQYLKLQEIQAPQGRAPIVVPALLKGNHLMWKTRSNERLKPRGILRFETMKGKDGKVRYKKWFEVMALNKGDYEGDISLTEQDIEQIKTWMLEPQFYEKLLASFCPHLHGIEDFKEAALLGIGSIRMSKPARILLVSDPAMGKSELLEYVSQVAPNAYYVTMANTRYTGLTTTSEHDKDTGRWTVTLGILPAAHQGIVCIDEFQVAKEEDVKSLNDVVERGKIRFALAGGNYGEADANAVIMIACNPHEGKVVSDTHIVELLKFMGKGALAFLSRMNLVLFMKDNATDEEEEAVARHMYRNNSNTATTILEQEEKEVEKPTKADRFEENWYRGYESEEFITPLPGLKITINTPIEFFGKQWIRKLLYYIVNYIPVEPMAPEYEDRLIKYYMDNRKDVTSNINKLMNRRYMRHAIILSQVRARLKGLSKPSQEDIDHILNLLAKNMETAAYDPHTQEVDPNMVNGNLPRSTIAKQNKEEQLWEGIEKAVKLPDGKTDKGYFTLDEVCFCCSMIANSVWTDENKIEKAIEQLARFGKLYNKYGAGKYTINR